MQTQALRPAADVVSRRLGDIAVLIRLSTNRIYELNVTAARLWELLQGGITAEAVVDVLDAEFDAPRTAIEQDVEALSRVMVAEGLLVAE